MTIVQQGSSTAGADPDIEIPMATAVLAPAHNPSYVNHAQAQQQSSTTYTIPPPKPQVQSQQPPPATIITHTTYTIPAPGATVTTEVRLPGLGTDSCGITCPYCKAQTRTVVQSEIDIFTICMFILLLFLFWPVCWLPFVLPTCKTVHHYCATCSRKVGTTRPCSS